MQLLLWVSECSSCNVLLSLPSTHTYCSFSFLHFTERYIYILSVEQQTVSEKVQFHLLSLQNLVCFILIRLPHYLPVPFRRDTKCNWFLLCGVYAREVKVTSQTEGWSLWLTHWISLPAAGFVPSWAFVRCPAGRLYSTHCIITPTGSYVNVHAYIVQH